MYQLIWYFIQILFDYIALKSFIPFSIPIENKKRKPVSASYHHKYNQNLLKNSKVDPKFSPKQKRFGKSVLVSPVMKNGKIKSIFQSVKTKNNENYNDGNSKNGFKNNISRSKPFTKEINFSQSHANLTFANPFFYSSNFFKNGNLKETSNNIQRANNYYVHSFNNIDDLHKRRLQTSPTSKDNKKYNQTNNYIKENKESRYAIAIKKSISPPKKSIFWIVDIIKYHYH